VEPDDVALLSSAEGRQLLAHLPAYDEQGALSLASQLREAGHSPGLVAAALTQSRLRTRAAARWGGSMASWLLFTPEGAEQATRPEVAAIRAERFGEGSVADLGCGVGVDALALDRRGLTVDAFERDRLTAVVAEANSKAAPWGAHVCVHHSDVTSLPRAGWSSYDAVFADPARRRGGRRLFHPEQWSPSLSWVLDLPVASLGVKVAPGLDHDLVPGATEMAVLSDRGEVLEAALYRGHLRQDGVTRSALLLPGRHQVTDLDLPDDPPPVRPVGRYLHEPDGAVIRAGLVAVVAAQVDGWLIDSRIAYLSSDEPASSPFIASYAVTAVMPFSLKRLREHLRAERVGRVVVKKRGSAVDLDDLQRRLKLDRSEPGERTVFLTRVEQDPLVIVTKRLPNG
jgi:THUMP domain-like